MKSIIIGIAGGTGSGMMGNIFFRRMADDFCKVLQPCIQCLYHFPVCSFLRCKDISRSFGTIEWILYIAGNSKSATV